MIQECKRIWGTFGINRSVLRAVAWGLGLGLGIGSAFAVGFIPGALAEAAEVEKSPVLPFKVSRFFVDVDCEAAPPKKLEDSFPIHSVCYPGYASPESILAASVREDGPKEFVLRLLMDDKHFKLASEVKPVHLAWARAIQDVLLPKLADLKLPAPRHGGEKMVFRFAVGLPGDEERPMFLFNTCAETGAQCLLYLVRKPLSLASPEEIAALEQDLAELQEVWGRLKDSLPTLGRLDEAGAPKVYRLTVNPEGKPEFSVYAEYDMREGDFTRAFTEEDRSIVEIQAKNRSLLGDLPEEERAEREALEKMLEDLEPYGIFVSAHKIQLVNGKTFTRLPYGLEFLEVRDEAEFKSQGLQAVSREARHRACRRRLALASIEACDHLDEVQERLRIAEALREQRRQAKADEYKFFDLESNSVLTRKSDLLRNCDLTSRAVITCPREVVSQVRDFIDDIHGRERRSFPERRKVVLKP